MTADKTIKLFALPLLLYGLVSAGTWIAESFNKAALHKHEDLNCAPLKQRIPESSAKANQP